MALKIEHKCSRCHRVSLTEVETVALAVADEDNIKKRAEALESLRAFVAQMPPDMVPDLFVVRKGQAIIAQTNLCDAEDAKRSCVARVNTLVEECMTLDPRAPRVRKAKEPTAGATEPPATPPDAPDVAPAEGAENAADKGADKGADKKHDKKHKA